MGSQLVALIFAVLLFIWTILAACLHGIFEPLVAHLLWSSALFAMLLCALLLCYLKRLEKAKAAMSPIHEWVYQRKGLATANKWKDWKK